MSEVKITAKGFLLSVAWVAIVSLICYIALMPLCERFVPFLRPFVLLISVSLFVFLFYLACSCCKTFFAELSGKILMLSKGFLIKRKIRLNLEFAVSVKLLTTPLTRLLGLSNLLIIFEGSVIFLPLLRVRDAEEIYRCALKISDNNEKL